MTNKEKYIAYTQQHTVPLFFEPFWLDIHKTEWDVIYAADHQYFTYFVYSIEKKMKFKIIRNGFLTPYTGFLFSDKNLTPHSKEVLTKKIIALLPSFHELHVDLHPAAGINIVAEGFVTKKKITNILDITDVKKTHSNYKSALKRQISKAMKLLTIIEKDDIQLFYELHEKTFIKQNLSTVIPYAAFEQTWNACKKNNCGHLLFALDQHQNVHAALFLTYDDECGYYLAGGTDAKFYGSGAMSYLMHSAIELTSSKSKKYFDFEGSMLPNVNRFFSNFSPVEIPYINFSKMDSRLLQILKKLKK